MFERFFAFNASRRPSRDSRGARRRAMRLAAPALERRLERLEDRLALSADAFLTINTTYGAFQVELYDSVTPQTVSNFMHYVNTNSFTDSIFHRSLPGFVLQAGGFTTSSATFSSTSQFTAIPNQGTIASEAGIPNSVGTLSMALFSGPDSATSQWFINLADNASLDDTSAGGPYTVFGKVIGNGMQVVDALAGLPRQNQGGVFDNLPVDPAHGNQLAEITSIAVDSGITGEVFNDVNVNGAFDAGEVGVPGQIVYIDTNNNGVLDNGEASSTSDAFGQYSFSALTPGSYVVREVVPANHGLTVTTPAGAGATVNVIANTTVSGPNFGDVQVSTIAPLPVSSAPLPSSPEGNTAYIQAVYLDVLGHAADASGLAAWQAAMEGGVSRSAVAQAIWSSVEHRGLEVDQYYQTFFGRQADPGGRTFWISEFSAGNDERIIAACFLLSGEYQRLHNSDTTFLGALYTDVFNRPPDPTGLSAWLAALQNGSQTRLNTAVSFVVADETSARIVDGFFADFLHRSGSADRQNYVTALDTNTMTVEGIGVAILASDEFFANTFNASVPH